VYLPDEHIRLARRELRVLGATVPVGSRAFEVIEVLARAAGEIVSKNELMDRIWPGAIVTDNTLHVHAMAVRKALGPYRNLLKTESGRGFRLLGDWTVSRHDAARPSASLQRIRIDGESPLTNFPLPVTRLIGRRAAVARLRDLMSAYRLVTLTGPGGIGKTSVALNVARDVVGEFADGGWLAELASLSDPALVPAAVADALRLPAGPAHRHYPRNDRACRRQQDAAPVTNEIVSFPNAGGFDPGRSLNGPTGNPQSSHSQGKNRGGLGCSTIANTLSTKPLATNTHAAPVTAIPRPPRRPSTPARHRNRWSRR